MCYYNKKCIFAYYFNFKAKFMATKQNQNLESQDPEVVIESAINKSEAFLHDNGKLLITILIAVVIVVGGYFGYKYLYQAPRVGKAADMMFVAEQQFAIDSFAVALNGDGNNAGFLEVIEKYGATAQGNIANHYAGVCYIKMGEMDKAMEYLKKFDATEGAPNVLVNAQNFGLQADILSQKQNYKEAAKMYEKAIEAANNSFTTPIYLKKAALVYTQLGDNKKALELYQRVADEFGSSMEARDIEKFIGQLEQK